MRSADVVVIGGGCIGASTAFQLTAPGVRDVHLVERRHLAAGASGKSGDPLTQAVLPMLTKQYGHWEGFAYLAPLNIAQAEAELSGTKRVPSP